MAYIMTTEAEIEAKAGAGKDAAVDTTMMTAFNLQAESTINVLCRFNFSDAVTAGLNADVVGILSDVASSLAAINCISYDMSGYTSRTEAEDMINVQRDSALRGLSLLRDKKQQLFIRNA